MIVEEASTKWNSIAVLPTYFASKVTNKFAVKDNEFEFHYDRVQRWTKKLSQPLWKHRLVMYPVNIARSHWGLGACISTPSKDKMQHRIMFLDSLHDPENNHMIQNMIEKHLTQEGLEKHTKYGLKKPKSVFIFEERRVPQQTNGFDCGVFTCAFAFCLAYNLPVHTFTQSNMNFFRKHMVLSVSQGTLHPIVKYNHFVDSLVDKIRK